MPLASSTAVMAIDSTAAPSGSVIEPSATIAATLSPAEVKSSSSIAVSVGLSSASAGASLTGLTVIAAVSVATRELSALAGHFA